MVEGREKSAVEEGSILVRTRQVLPDLSKR